MPSLVSVLRSATPFTTSRRPIEDYVAHINAKTRRHDAVVTMRKALSDAGLLKHVIAGDSWRTWRILLIAAMGEQLTEDEREIFTRVTGREHEPNKRVSELEVIAGRRGGKTIALAALATYICSAVRSSRHLSSGGNRRLPLPWHRINALP